MYNDLLVYILNVLSDSNYSFEELMGVVSRICAEIAPKINIGLINTQFNNKKNIYSDDRVKVENAIYKGEKYNADNVVQFKSPIDDLGDYSIDIYPIEEFTVEEKEFLKNMNYLFSQAISKIKQQEVIKQTTILDPLTGMLNRDGIHGYISEISASNKIGEYDTLFINVKDCAEINKLCGGIQFGDILLRKYAYIISEFLEDGEKIARPGGDNFIIIIKKERLKDILKFLESVEVSAVIRGSLISTTIKANVGYYDNKPGDTMNTVMNSSKFALDYVKSINGTDVIEFDENLQNRMDLVRNIRTAFINAIEEKRIIPYYQPKVNSESYELYGAEALCRWIKSDGSLLSPAVFIPALEHDGFVCDIDFEILERVCSDIKRTIDSGLEPVPVSVNFSKYHFIRPDVDARLVKKIVNIIDSYNIDHKYIEVEFTESGKIEDYSVLKEIVDGLHKEGIKVSVDDFGTGYSSLQLIEEVPFDTVKMDKSFADRIGTNEGNIIFKYITSMMKELGREIVCEGVETQQQIDFLNEIRCNIIQGYYFDRPLPYESYRLKLDRKNSYHK